MKLQEKLHEVYKLPCHSQATERCLKLVQEAAATVCGEHSRNGFIQSSTESHRLLLYFTKKRELMCKKVNFKFEPMNI